MFIAMEKLLCVVLLIATFRQANATKWIPNEGPARYNAATLSNNGDVEYEVTTPERVTKTGKRLPVHKHFMKYSNGGKHSETVYYKLDVFDRSFRFRLKQNNQFVSPSLTVEHVYSDTRRLPFAGGLLHCFYRGHIQGDPLSSAVFNLCNGLRGSFVSNGQRYFIEPTKDDKTNSTKYSRKYHIVYRHSSFEGNYRSNGTLTSTCGLEETAQPLSLARGKVPHPANNSTRRRRKRRELDEAFVETMVTADKAMVDAFPSKADLESYIITLMGVVAQVYHDKTIGNPISIVLVKIVLLETEEPGLHISSDAADTLRSFCRWQAKEMTKETTHPEHHDTAILLTKRDICRRPGRCDTLGLAELGTMCLNSRSCALAEDSGLSTAYTIAHELGHVFNLPHDGDHNICTRGSGRQHLMAPSLSFDTKPWSWSTCSRDKLTDFLDLGYGDCLSDKPHEKARIKFHDTLPGEKYSVDKQCQIVFGEKSSLCPFMEPCRRLWCVMKVGDKKGCSTNHMPWADGTPCSKNKWCIRGQCVKKRRLKPVDGKWGEWAPYDQCTRTCGGGVSFSFRKCNKPAPKNGGKYCIGSRKRFKSCNIQDCPKTSPDFRYIQCARRDGLPQTGRSSLNYQRRQWVPKYAGISKKNQCKLFCRQRGTAVYSQLSEKVIDGTPCNQETTDICVDGRCMPAGCDRVLNSDAKFDECGVCKGDNSSCRRFSGTFNETNFGYNYIFTIPVGATNIVITQYGWNDAEDESFLALQRESGSYLLNGGMTIQLGVREFRAASSKIWYSGSDKATEQIKINGKTTERIKVLVLEVGEIFPPNVHYELNEVVVGPQKFKWDKLGPWTQCSHLCQGIRKRRSRCVRAVDRVIVSSSRCDPATRPSSVTEECNISCRLSWHIQRLGNCSARCGSGYEKRYVRCMRISRGQWDIVRDEHCAELRKPEVHVPCQGSCEGTRWKYSQWSKCSKSCNGGTQSRQSFCQDTFGEILKERDCRASDRQAITRQCNKHKCPWWSAGQWSSCSVTCGSGWQQRPVKCEGEWGQVRDRVCNSAERPLTRKPCDLESCPYWQHGEWSKCSVTCGKGMMTREVQCLSGTLVRKRESDERCLADKPASSKDCKFQDCATLYAAVSEERTLNHYWRLSLWKPCSVTCGRKPGRQYRDVECVHVTSKTQIVVDEKHCEHTPKPTASKICSVLPCTSWRHGPWSRCSAPCGRGVQLRVVKCTFDDWKITKDKNCDMSQRPLKRRVCQIKRCVPRTEAQGANELSSTARLRPTTQATTVGREKPTWRAHAWSECSTSCGEGIKQREVVCTFKNGRLSSDCNERNKPVTRMACNLRSCPQWIAEEWNECSVTCGEGIRTRSVRCNGGSAVCNPRTKPEAKTKCNQGQCPKWRTGEWMKCSVTCGDGFKRRTVACDPISAQCDTRTKPEAIVRCNLGSCPKWTAEEWTECSVTCGNGFRRRTVKCDSTSAKCVSSMKPETISRCNLGSCPKWTTGEWTQCSVTCGDGFKRRIVSCDLKGRCDTRSKPDAIARCNIGSCPKWTTGGWSECPVTCGGGIKRRVVTCDSLKAQCDTRTKPEDTTRCNTEPCPQWVPGKWSECSVTCGSGFRQREVTCSSDRDNCPASNKPGTSTVCNMGPCPEWTVREWTACSVTCGNGFKRRLVTCDAVNSRCDAKTKPEAIARCSLGSCPEWTVGQWSECSTTCGDGFKRRDIKCSNTNARCLTSSKPESTVSCNLGPCPTWQAGSWSQCSVTCGNGVKRRVVQCSQPDATCDTRTKPVTSKSCMVGTCPVWRTGRWSRCSKTCGTGAKARAVWCSRSDVRCDSSDKPVKTTDCNEGTCPVWKVGEWSKCSVTCGSGVRSRAVECSRSDARCDVRRKPSTRSRCYLASCPVWRTGGWSRCSATCGNGLRKRTVQCSRSDVACDASLKPTDSENCNLGSCPEWRALGWSQCSVTCGDGFKRRIVQCSRRGGCDPKTRPESTARCNLTSCPQWNAGPWTRCSVTCGNGFKRRLVQCSHGSDCNVGSKPETTAACNLGSCPEWKAGLWSQCSTTCGGGFKERTVECDGLEGRCDERFKPTMKMACNLGECPRWKIGEWAECSVTCGNGFKERKIECVTGINITCDERTKPVVTAKCNRGPCPKWKTGRWTECSRTCGEGVKRRAVACLALNNGSRLPESACDVNKKPSGKEVCNVMDCVPGAEWYKGEWGKCSVYCGIGDKYRDIWCASPNGTRIADLYCSGERKPRATRPCNKRQRCGAWEFGLWDRCSKTCGKGFKTRAIRCLHQLEYKSETYCDSKTRPLDNVQCNVKACPSFLNIYHWQTSVWSKCSKECGYGRKSRIVWCVDISRRNVSNKLCDPSRKPTEYEPCFNLKCPAKWKHGYWTECSKSCGRGYQYRAVECVARHGRLQSSACDRRTKPPVWRTCNLGHCNGYMFWRVGPWSQCSVTCGVGVMRRVVKCFSRNSSIVPDSLCETPTLTKPDSLRSCLMKACEPRSCKEVQTVTGVQTDGEQTLMIQGKQLKVYCFAMMSGEPKEYITVKTSAENFAEIYPKILRDPKKCPANGTHIQDCKCEDEDYKNAGASYFSKLRIDLTTMKIIADDKQFASTRGLNPPPYGTAGDCYSAQGKCPQGRFSINLHETGIRLTSKVMWGSTGRAYSQIIYRYPGGLQVIGKCGGFCGICSPDASVGLQIELSDGDS